MASILEKGLTSQVKRGLGKEYIPRTEALSSLRGKIDIAESIKTQALLKKQLVCTYDEFSVNGKMNRIIKSTVLLLLKTDISKERKKQLKNLLVYFADVEVIDLYSVDWHIHYVRNNQTYLMLISICYLIVKGLLQTNAEGTVKLMTYLDEQRMCRLYEKFILKYYKKEFPMLTVAASQIHWQLDDNMDFMLPMMKSDIMLSYGEKVLIIDAKYYTHTTQSQYNTRTLHSENLYQIFTYVKNKETEMAMGPHEVAGMLLYAKTDEEILPDCTYRMSGNKISVKTLNLDCDFHQIANQLDSIVMEYFDLGEEFI